MDRTVSKEKHNCKMCGRVIWLSALYRKIDQVCSQCQIEVYEALKSKFEASPNNRSKDNEWGKFGRG